MATPAHGAAAISAAANCHQRSRQQRSRRPAKRATLAPYTNMSWWIWVLAGLALLAAEFATSTMHVGFFAVGALLVALLVGVGLDLPLWLQFALFTVSSLLTFAFVRPILVRKLKLDFKPVVDSMIGEQARAMDDIGVADLGKAEFRGSTWSARNVGETALARGQRCVIAGIEGLVIQVKAS
jgi:membrane protein implicated in regulation of membrane protease activity